VFNRANDRIALNTLAQLFPKREIVPIYSGDFIWGPRCDALYDAANSHQLDRRGIDCNPKFGIFHDENRIEFTESRRLIADSSILMSQMSTKPP